MVQRSSDITLDAGCRVSDLRRGDPAIRGTLRIWERFGRATGATALSLRILEAAPGLSPGFRNAGCDEVLYVLEGVGTVFLDGHPFAVGPDTGIHLLPGVSLALDNPGPRSLLLASARCPDDGTPAIFEAARTRPDDASSAPPPSTVARLAGRPAEPASDGRSYQVVIDASGSGAPVTQFVGSIPPGRAPDHFHEYEEVLIVLEGHGRAWASRENTPVTAGTCVFLPRRQVHCMENLGTGPMRLMGLFYPSGSPAAARRLPTT
jgi:mannose-6-phosphate isomerase-like protein (cupin superfamily)